MDHYLLSFPSEDEVVIIVNSLLYIHYLCSEHHLLVVTVTREITTTQCSPHQYEYKKVIIKCIDLHYCVVVNITTIHIHYQVVTILGSIVHFKSSDVHYSVFTVYISFFHLLVNGFHQRVR